MMMVNNLVPLLLLLLLTSSINSFVKQHTYIETYKQWHLKMSRISSSINNEEGMVKLFEETFEKVVYISTLTQAFNPLTLNFFEIDSQSGSGFVWNNTGMIVTNYHVIEQSYRSKADVQVTFLGNEKTRVTYRAKIHGVDPNRDIAVLKIDDSDDALKISSKSLPLGDSKDLKVGSTAIAIGTPFGLDSTMTVGIISGLGRTISSGPNRGRIYNGIQTDAAINPGNSGGPLLNSQGKLIGMNTAILSINGGWSGIGFAIPVDLLKVIVTALIRDGKITRKPTGLSFLSERQSRSLGINGGLVILNVEPSSPAETAGLRGLRSNSLMNISLGDVIIQVNGISVKREEDFLSAIDQNIAGDTVQLKVLRLIKAEGREMPKSVETSVRLKLT